MTERLFIYLKAFLKIKKNDITCKDWPSGLLFYVSVSFWFPRLRVNCVGVFDVLTFDNSQTNHLALMPQYQVQAACSRAPEAF